MPHLIGMKEILGMGKVGRWFPGVFRQWIACPADAELSVGGGTPMGDDGFHGVFFFSLDNGRRGR